MAERMPALFIGHGDPNEDALLGEPLCAAVGVDRRDPAEAEGDAFGVGPLVVEDAAVTVSTTPRTIHDFGGFPRELYQVQYPRPVIPTSLRASRNCLLMCRCVATTAGVSTTVLGRFCATSIHKPIFQWFNSASMKTQPPSFHYEVGTRLALLREEGILIFGSGNVVHNLHAYAWGRHAPEPYDWAITFETRVRELLLAGEYKPLVNYEDQLGSEAELAVPTPDHYVPLLYVAGTRIPSETLTFPVEGVDGGSVSMLASCGVLGKWLPARKLSLNAEHGAAAISVRRPETDLVPGGSRSGFGRLRNHEVDSSEPLD